MKTRALFFSVLAALVTVFSCEQEETILPLSSIQVDATYLSLPMEGGSVPLSVTAASNWAFEEIFVVKSKDEEGNTIENKYPLPTWLNASATNGEAGLTVVNLSAEATLDGRSCELRISCGGQTQIINVIQGVAGVSAATCAEIVAGPDSKTYMVTGVVTKIANEQYGNWYLNDGTEEIYIYGTKNAAGNYPKDAGGWGKGDFDFGVGDEVTVQGPKTTYNGTVELVDVAVIKIAKSLIKVESIDSEDAVIAKDGGELTVTLDNKGDGLFIDIPEDAKDWLFISGINGNVVTLKALPNEGGSRAATLVFKTKKSGKEYSTELSLTQEGAIIELSIAEFNEQEDGLTQYKITGVIAQVANAAYGNYYIRDWSGTTYVYGTGAKGDFEAAGYKAGDIVTLVGQKTTYVKDDVATIEMVNSVVENCISVVDGLSLMEIAAKEDSKEVYYIATGVVKEIVNDSYGNVWLEDESGELYVYGTYPGWGAAGDARKGLIAAEGIQVGDVLSVIGVKSTYNDAPQISNGIFFSHTPAAE